MVKRLREAARGAGIETGREGKRAQARPAGLHAAGKAAGEPCACAVDRSEDAEALEEAGMI